MPAQCSSLGRGPELILGGRQDSQFGFTWLIADSRAALETLPARYPYRVICGLTGSGKSRLLAALAREGAQTIDLEGLARHRGSLLGDLPDDPQPSQKLFESLLLRVLEGLDPARPVFVESESKKIGKLHTPEVLLQEMRSSPCLNLTADIPVRVALLKEEYRRFAAKLESVSGKKITTESLKKGIEIVNAKRMAVKRLAALRAAEVEEEGNGHPQVAQERG